MHQSCCKARDGWRVAAWIAIDGHTYNGMRCLDVHAAYLQYIAALGLYRGLEVQQMCVPCKGCMMRMHWRGCSVTLQVAGQCLCFISCIAVVTPVNELSQCGAATIVMVLQLMEDLEQLKVLENGFKIKVIIVDHSAHGVDEPEDVASIESIITAHGWT